ncbi:MAG: S8 family serine peptidase [Burkholderiales bacterium]|nr:S8 family serine peptidase [Burkholderiales bacterium]
MKKFLTLWAVAALAACGGGGGGGGGDSTAPPPSPPVAADPLAADVIVQLKPGTSVGAIATTYGLTVVDQFGKRPIWRLRVAAGADVDAAVAALRGNGGVRFAERNLESDTPEGRKNNVYAIGGDAGVYVAQWAPQAIQLDAAHAVSTGQGIRIAVLDTGIDLAHPALAPRLARSANGALLGRDFVDDDADPSEAGSRADLGWGHGTHVAGLSVLTAPAATLMPVRVLDASGRGNTWVLAEALGWAVDLDGNPASDDGAHVINLSLGTLQRTDLLKTVIELADCSFDDDDDDFNDPGFDDDRARCALRFAAVVASAAGNGGSDTELQYPAAEPVKGALSVGASNSRGERAAFSNFGSTVQVAAPGESIVSTVPGGGYGTWSGTSMAAPFVAGASALVLATLPPGGDPAQPAARQWIPENVAKRIVDRSAALCGGSLRRLDAAGAVRDVQPADPLCP